MFNNINDQLQQDLEKVESSCHEQKPLVQRYLQNPFSVISSKIAALMKATLAPSPAETLENNLSEHYEADSSQEQYFYTRFTDRVDPSLYYIVFFRNKKF
ncbi:hypothetical protein NIES4073_11270 [Kalymmatonema gypsitolerans NIES-4073]|nr:hypothetical protein NIES4073_11270 [Scytonema sp. NIES-4073]